jgi:hypothetical protein
MNSWSTVDAMTTDSIAARPVCVLLSRVEISGLHVFGIADLTEAA